MSAVFFLIFIIIMLYIEQHYLNTNPYTPIFWFAIPICTIILLNNFVCTHFGFFKVYIPAILLNIEGLVSFWIGGLFVLGVRRKYLSSNKGKQHLFYQDKLYLSRSNFNYILVFGAFVLGIGILYLRSTLGSRSIFQLEDQEFGQSGIIAHIGNYVSICFIFCVAFIAYRVFKLKLMIPALVICLILKFATSIKAELMLPIICSIIFLLTTKKIKINVKTIFIFFISFLILFSMMGIFFNIGSKSNQLDYVIAFFFFYIVCGEVGLSEWMNSHSNLFQQDSPNLISVFFINVYEKFFGHEPMVKFSNFSSLDWITISDDQFGLPFRTNVFSLIGEVFLNCGHIISIIFFFLLGVYYYIIYLLAHKNICLTVLYSYICGVITLSFFSSYILLPAYIEIQLLIVAFYFLSLSRQTKK